MVKSKIFIDASGIVTKPDGLGKYSSYLLESLLKSGKYEFLVLHQGILSKSHPLFLLEKDQVKMFAVDIPTIGPKRDIMMFGLRNVINQCDVFHCLSSYLPAFGVRIPSIVTIHDLKYLLYAEFFNNRLKMYYYKWIMHRGVRNASYMIAVSDATKRDIAKLGVPSDKIQVIHEATTISSKLKGMLPDILSGKEYWLFVGENRIHKNIQRIIEAYYEVEKKLGKKCPFFVFAGSRFEMVRNRHPHDKFIFLGSISEEVLVGLYKHALALVYPSLYEGFGLPILEAMALGVPVITSDCSSMPEVAGEAALLVDPYDSGQIANAMWRLSSSRSEEGLTLRARGFERVATFSWQKAAEQVYGIYEKILSPP